MSKGGAHALAAQEPSARYLVGGAAQGDACLIRAFDLLATAPGGVARLRELISALAIGGLLVPQDEGDEPASELIQRVLLDKVNQIGVGANQARNIQADVDVDECPFSVPSNWQWVRFGALVLSSEAGWSPSCDAGPRKGDSWGVLKVSSVSWGEFNPSENKQLPASLTSRPEYEVRVGDFLLSRANTAELVARSVVVRDAAPKLMLSDKIIRINLSPLVDKRFFNMVNNGTWARSYYIANASGTSSSMKNVGRAVILHMPVPLPPLAEQHRIVARVEELMRLCDALEAKGRLADAQHARLVSTLFDALTRSQSPQELAEHWQRISAHFDLLLDRSEAIDALEQTILQLAVRGLLVPQDPRDEPASELLACIRVEKDKLIAEGRLKPAKPLLQVPDDEKAFELPDGWAWVRFGTVVLGSEAGWSPSCDPGERQGDAWGVLKVSAVSWGAFKSNENKRLPASLAPKPEYEVQDNDFLISRANTAELVARSVVVNSPEPRLMLSDKIIRLDISSLVDREFFNMVNNGRWSRDYYAVNASGTSSSMKNVGRTVILNMPVPVPPLAEQHRIVTRVQQLRALCAQLRERLHTASATQSRLAQALVDQVTAA
jgi:type I restriction enzyme S subunit